MSKRRIEAMKRVAYELDMSYQETDEWGLLGLLKDFKLFRRGLRKRITNILHRQDGLMQMDTRVFDYSYTVSTGKSSRTFRQTVFFVESKALGLPEFLMKPENFFHRIGTLLGMQDINFEEYPEFSKQYLLRGADEDFIRATMTDPVLKFFTVEKDWCVEGVNYYLILYQRGVLLPRTKIKRFYRKGMEMAELLIRENPMKKGEP